MMLTELMEMDVQYWAIAAVKIRYPSVDDTVLGNGNTIGNPHSLSYKVWEIQTKIVKLYGKSVKISKKYFLLSEIQVKNRKITHIQWKFRS